MLNYLKFIHFVETIMFIGYVCTMQIVCAWLNVINAKLLRSQFAIEIKLFLNRVA